jgi:hypothetical protein
VKSKAEESGLCEASCLHKDRLLSDEGKKTFGIRLLYISHFYIITMISKALRDERIWRYDAHDEIDEFISR